MSTDEADHGGVVGQHPDDVTAAFDLVVETINSDRTGWDRASLDNIDFT